MPHGSSGLVRVSIGVLAGIVAVSGLARVGVVESRSSPAASVIRPVVTQSATPSPSVVPSAAATQTIPTPAGTPDVAGDLSSLGLQPFVTVPFTPPSVPSNVKTDLTDRLPVFDEVTTLADPEDSKFQTLDQFVALLPVADRSTNRSALTAEGLQGAYYDVAVSVTGNRVYKINLLRFATEPGAATHLSHFVTRPASGEALTATASAVPGSHEFLGHTDNKVGAIDVYYLRVGRYFASVETVAPVGDPTARSQAKTLAMTVHDALT